MSKKSDAFYFNNFIECADCTTRAASMLKSVLENFTPGSLDQPLEQIHQVEQEADTHKHELMEELVRTFITPIECEDIMSLSQNLDDVTDAIEDVLLRIYMCNVQEIRSEAIDFAAITVQCCEILKELMVEFKDFKKSKSIKELVIKINQLEEDADKLFVSSIRNLYTTCNDPIQIISWRDIFNYFERCMDACEHAADVVEMVIMKNS